MSKATKEEVKKMWKIEGEAFEKVKAAKDALKAAHEEAKRATEAAHKALWEAINEAVPETKGDENHTLNSETESLGFYVVRENPCGHIGAGILGALLAASK